MSETENGGLGLHCAKRSKCDGDHMMTLGFTGLKYVQLLGLFYVIGPMLFYLQIIIRKHGMV